MIPIPSKTDKHRLESCSPVAGNRLTDRHGRTITYLRLSVTDRCNLDCRYCNPGCNHNWFSHSEILRYEEMIKLAALFTMSGVSKIRITGGEPLVRKNLSCLVRSLKQIKGIDEVAITTNGVLLGDTIDELKDAGLDCLNISLDTLNPEIFKRITGRSRLGDVLSGIDKARSIGLSKIKINVVPMAGINETELTVIADHFLKKGLSVRFIEQMPIGKTFSDFIPTEKIKKRIESHLGPLTEIMPNSADGPAKSYRVSGYRGEVGFISAMSNHFCARCNRLRLTADGKLRPCLMDDKAIDIKHLLRNGADDVLLLKAMKNAVNLKPEAHSPWPTVKTGMTAIGG